MARKPKKSYTGAIVGVVVVVLLGGAAYLNRDAISAKWHSVRGTAAVAQPDTNEPPPPPELTVDDIWQKVGAAYKPLTSLSAAGKFVSVIDWSLVNSARAANGPQTTSADETLRLGRPDNFRLDIVEQEGQSNLVSTGWSAGKGDFTQMYDRRVKMPGPYPVFARLEKPGAAFVSELYFSQADVPAVSASQTWTRDSDHAQNVNGKPCYVLAGTLYTENALVWIDRGTFLVTQVQLALDGKLADDALLEPARLKSALSASGITPMVTDADVAQLKIMLRGQSKLKGTITETFTDIKANPTLALTDFEPGAIVVAAPAQGAPPPGRGIGGSGPNGVPGRMRRNAGQ
jgi:hypothetical protein